MKINRQDFELLSYLKQLFLIHHQSYQKAEELNSFLYKKQSLETLNYLKAERLNKKIYLEDSYFKRVNGDFFHKYPYAYASYKAYEPFLVKESQALEERNYEVESKLGYFSEPFPYPVLLDQDTHEPWMSIIPHEIETMRSAIAQSEGTVLVLGAGLLYFPIKAAEKNNVHKVIVIDKNPEILFFANKLLNKEPSNQKITLIQQDALEAIKNIKADYIFADLWHWAEDAIPLYIPLRKIQCEQKLHVSYWIENEILIYIRDCVLTLWEENLNDIEKQNPNLYKDKKGQDISSSLINALARYFKNIEIHNVKEAKFYLKNETLRNLVLDISLK